MFEFFRALSKMGDIFIPIVFIVFVLYQILNKIDKTKTISNYKRIKIYMILVAIASGAIVPISDGVYTSMMRTKMKELLVNEITNKNEIYLNKKKLVDSSKILKELERIKYVNPHNSHTTEYKFVVDIKYQQQWIHFKINQDNQRAHEFWVYTDYFSDNYQYIGRINTDYFDIYTSPKIENFY